MTSCCCATRSRRGSADVTEEPMPARRPRPSAPSVTVPLRLADGYTTTARVFTFDGLADGAGAPRARARGPGRRTGGATDGSHAAGAAAQRVPDRRRVRQPALRLRSAAARGGRADRRAGAATCSTCARRAAGSGSTPSSTPTRCRTPASTPTRPTSRSATPRTSATTRSRRRCCTRSGETQVGLLSNNPDKAAQLERLGVTVTERVPTGVHLSPRTTRYLAAKARRGAHTLDLSPDPVRRPGA